MPERIRSGGESFMIQAIAIITASVGVPVTQKRRSPSFLRRTGTVSVSEWPAPDCSSVGATIQTSSEKARAIVSSTLSPVAFTPSSLVRRMRIARPAMAAAPGGGKAGRPQPARSCRVETATSKEIEMRVPHNSFIVVADGKKSLFFRNEGDGDFPNLIVEHKDGHADAEDRELKSDAPGRAFSSVGSARSAYQETDYHQLEEEKFVAETAELLNHGALRNDFESL